jgi:hypothetical protein
VIVGLAETVTIIVLEVPTGKGPLKATTPIEYVPGAVYVMATDVPVGGVKTTPPDTETQEYVVAPTNVVVEPASVPLVHAVVGVVTTCANEVPYKKRETNKRQE